MPLYWYDDLGSPADKDWHCTLRQHVQISSSTNYMRTGDKADGALSPPRTHTYRRGLEYV